MISLLGFAAATGMANDLDAQEYLESIKIIYLKMMFYVFTPGDVVP